MLVYQRVHPTKSFDSEKTTLKNGWKMEYFPFRFRVYPTGDRDL